MHDGYDQKISKMLNKNEEGRTLYIEVFEQNSQIQEDIKGPS